MNELFNYHIVFLNCNRMRGMVLLKLRLLMSVGGVVEIKSPNVYTYKDKRRACGPFSMLVFYTLCLLLDKSV